jgi:hypothetical protein
LLHGCEMTDYLFFTLCSAYEHWSVISEQFCLLPVMNSSIILLCYSSYALIFIRFGTNLHVLNIANLAAMLIMLPY